MATASEQRKQAVAYMKSRTKKNNYTQGGKRTYFFGYPDNKPGNTSQKGYSDCSAAARAAIKAATGIDIGGNTSAQINNRNKKGIVVHTTDGFYPDESKLLPGDCLYFKGNTSHPLDVGHVEMYTGKNECTGHGGGTGPTVKNLKSYCKSRATSTRRYFMAVRWIKDDAQASGNSSAPAESASNVLEKGMHNNAAVKAMQKNLITLGYLANGEDDGDFGPKTEAALKKFQKAHSLTADGKYGPKSEVAMKKALADQKTAKGSKVRIINGNCHARSAPNKESKSLGTAYKGETFEYQGQTSENGWRLIKYKNQNAWVSGKYSRVED